MFWGSKHQSVWRLFMCVQWSIAPTSIAIGSSRQLFSGRRDFPIEFEMPNEDIQVHYYWFTLKLSGTKEWVLFIALSPRRIYTNAKEFISSTDIQNSTPVKFLHIMALYIGRTKRGTGHTIKNNENESYKSWWMEGGRGCWQRNVKQIQLSNFSRSSNRNKPC